jgi:ATP-binding cassette subfamily F protein 3
VIALEAVSKSYGGRPVLAGVTLRVGHGERVGLVGDNGAGKTTLCRIAAGAEPPDAGRVHLDRGATVGYLPQETRGEAERSVLAEALSGHEALWRLEGALEDLARAMARPDPDPALIERYGEVQHRFESMGGYRLEVRAKVILGGLGFRPEEMHRPLREFSGGWRTRAALARLLLVHPALLLLDEPTNHLDLASLEWLEGFLAAYDGAVVIVSHDRYFLNRVVTVVAELAGGGVTVYPGGYDDFLVEREARRRLLEARARNQARQVGEIERFIERFRYKATKARQVQSRVKMLERLERIDVGPAARPIRVEFPPPPRAGRAVARLSGIHKAYGDRVVYVGVDLTIERGERVALVGPNGAGKSTLLKILAGVLPFERGERVLGPHVAVHYYAQHQLDALAPTRTALEELAEAAPELPVSRLRALLGRFLLGGDAADRRVAVLSGGEKARVALARMLVRPAALLCLDEPTNHLDLASKEVLEAALAAFAGTIVFISHDRYFINRLATRVVEVGAGRLASFLGNYDDHLARAAAAAPRAVRGPARLASPPPARGPRSPDRLLTREVKALRARLGALEAEIATLEARLAETGQALADPIVYRDGARARDLAVSRQETEEQVAWLMKEWEELSERLAAMVGEDG